MQNCLFQDNLLWFSYNVKYQDFFPKASLRHQLGQVHCKWGLACSFNIKGEKVDLVH